MIVKKELNPQNSGVDRVAVDGSVPIIVADGSSIISSGSVIFTDEILDLPIVNQKVLKDPTPKKVAPPKEPVEGLIDNCGFLNVRKTPSAKADVLSVLKRGTVVMVDLDGSTENYYKVAVGKTEGYCVKEFIFIKDLKD